MMIGWPSLGDSCSAINRVVTSVPPPAVNGTTILIGCAGYVCAAADMAAMAPTKRTIVQLRKCRMTPLSMVLICKSQNESLRTLAAAVQTFFLDTLVSAADAADI